MSWTVACFCGTLYQAPFDRRCPTCARSSDPIDRTTRDVARAPATLLTRHIGAGEAWASVREVDRKWEQGERGWVVELKYEPEAPQSE
jgi:hypothetical protein